MNPPRDSAVALVWRPAPDSGEREVLWLRRGPSLRFGAGFFAFPGGKLDVSDNQIAVAGAAGPEGALRACAVRECFEETGLLLARGAERFSAEQRRQLRLEHDAGLDFGALLSREGLTLHADDLLEAGRWVTPAFYPSRFDARLFLSRAPAGQEPEFFGAEADEGGFVTPAQGLERWRQGTALLHPPNLNALRALQSETLAGGLERLRHPPDSVNHGTHRIEFQRGIVLVPQKSETLPPATHTNAYLMGLGDLVLVDPGSDDDQQLAALFEVVESLQAEGARLRAIALTHHHHDHLAGVAKVRARFPELPLWAHQWAEPWLDQLGLKVDRRLIDGEDLGLDGFAVKALHTPGHTRGHLAFWHPASGAAVVGDLMSGVSSIVIDPPEGRMVDYLASLERLRDLPAATLYPAHGPVMAGAVEKLTAALAHRRAREVQIVDALRERDQAISEMVPSIYRDAPTWLFPLAERSVLAHLEKLVQEERVNVRGERYHLRDGTSSGEG